MALGIWQPGDPLPRLADLPAFAIQTVTNTAQIAQLNDISEHEAAERIQKKNHFYLATLAGTAVAYGWIAEHTCNIGEVDLSFTLPEHERYLWDFKTYPQWRRHGIYTHFLQAILRQEQTQVERFWIMYIPGNIPAEHSIAHAGFHYVAEVACTQGHATGIILLENSDRAQAAVNLLKLPIVADTDTDTVSPSR